MKDLDLCKTCVYWVKNLPEEMYPKEEWEVLKKMICSIDAKPGDELCRAFRKSSCSIIDLKGGKER